MAEREFRTTPQWPIVTTPLSGDELVEVWKGGKQYYVPFSELGGMPAAHSGTHKHGGDDEVGTLDNLAYEIPKLDADGLIDSRVSDASTTTKGKVQLATNGEEDATKPPTSTDSRLKDARPPTAHAVQHIAGTDVIADATVSNSGLMSAADKVKADATIPAYIPTADQKAAMNGATTPSTSNPFLTVADSPDVEDVTDIKNWASFGEQLVLEPFLENVPKGPYDLIYFNGFWYFASGSSGVYKWDGIADSSGNYSQISTANVISMYYDEDIDEIICVGTGGIISIDSSDSVTTHDASSKSRYGITKAGTVYYILADSDIYSGTSLSSLSATGSAAEIWYDICEHDGYVYVSADGSKLYRAASGTTSFSLYLDTDPFNILDSIDGRLFCTLSDTPYSSLGELSDGEVKRYLQSSGNFTASQLAGKDGDLYAAAANSKVGKITIINAPSVNIPQAPSFYVNLLVNSDMPIGGRKVFRRTSAYDGNPVTITPPSGATFEGLSSLSLYGQYSFVELERISSAVFAVKDLKDKFAYVPTVGANNLPGYWSTEDNWIIRDKETVFVSLQYVSSGAATGVITISKDSLTPYSSRVKITGVNCNLLKASKYRISAVYDGSGFYTNGVAAGTTTPFTWAVGDAISFYTTFRLE